MVIKVDERDQGFERAVNHLVARNRTERNEYLVLLLLLTSDLCVAYFY